MKEKLFNPFLRIAGMKAFAISLIFLVASALLAWAFATNFDGALDIHFGGKSSLQAHTVMILIDAGALVLAFYLLAVVLTKGKTRFVDILGTVTLARFPLVLAPLLNIDNINTRIGDKILYGMRDKIGSAAIGDIHCQPCTISTFEYVYLIMSILLTLLMIIWYVALLYRAYTVSSNLKGAKAIISFIVGLILAEILSSIFIHFLL